MLGLMVSKQAVSGQGRREEKCRGDKLGPLSFVRGYVKCVASPSGLGANGTAKVFNNTTQEAQLTIPVGTHSCLRQ